MAIPFKSNVTVPNNWNLKTEQNTNLLSYNGILNIGDTGSTVQIRSGIAYFYTNNFTLGTTTKTVLKFMDNRSTELGNNNIPTNIIGNTVNIGNSNNKTVINSQNLTISTANGWTINNTTGTSGQVLTSNGSNLTPTWKDLNGHWEILKNYFTGPITGELNSTKEYMHIPNTSLSYTSSELIGWSSKYDVIRVLCSNSNLSSITYCLYSVDFFPLKKGGGEDGFSGSSIPVNAFGHSDNLGYYVLEGDWLNSDYLRIAYYQVYFASSNDWKPIKTNALRVYVYAILGLKYR